jgi:hypothetical protein
VGESAYLLGIGPRGTAGTGLVWRLLLSVRHVVVCFQFGCDECDVELLLLWAKVVMLKSPSGSEVAEEKWKQVRAFLAILNGTLISSSKARDLASWQ